ncbi:unnamed protein product [Malus baccata var. baccata]
MLWLISHCKVVTCAYPATPTPTVVALSAPLTMKPLSVAPVALNMRPHHRRLWCCIHLAHVKLNANLA